MLNQLTTIVLTPFDAISGQVIVLFDWLLSKGVREDTLIIILSAGGISLLMLMAGIMLMLFKYFRTRRAQKPAKAPKAKRDEAEKVQGPDPRFAIFKKRGGKKRSDKAKTNEPKIGQHDINQPNGAQQNADDATVQSLTDIERDMLALKELFDAGHINASVYVEETRKLYDKAQKYI